MLLVGDIVFEPLLYVYVTPPLGVIVNVLPEQIVPLFTVIVGVVFTVTFDVAEEADTQPTVLVPVIV